MDYTLFAVERITVTTEVQKNESKKQMDNGAQIEEVKQLRLNTSADNHKYSGRYINWLFVCSSLTPFILRIEIYTF